MVMTAELDLDGSATELAVRVRLPELGTDAGAVYVVEAPLAVRTADSEPQTDAPPAHPLMLQLTPEFELSLLTIAVKACVFPT
jgi:hypothetical protein